MGDSIVCLARIQRPKGLDGTLKLTVFGELLRNEGKNLSVISIYEAKGIEYGLLVQSVFIAIHSVHNLVFHNQYGILSLYGVNDVQQAEALQGLYIGLPLEVAQKRRGIKDDIYLFELLNLMVVDEKDHTSIGTVIRLKELGLNQLVVIQLYTSGDIIEVPINSPYLVNINTVSKTIVVRGIQDFFDL